MDNHPLIGEHEKHRRSFLCKTASCIGLVFTLLALGITFGVLVEEEEITDHNHWDILGITLNWPESSCREMNRTHHICHEPESLHSWTIHGLWPNRYDGSWPQYCNKHEKFNPGPIKDLIPEMETFWPNLMTDRPGYDFWTHEYEKHGTCAESLPDLSTEHKYFEKTLNLRNDMNVLESLEGVGVVPSNTDTYSLKQFRDGFDIVTKTGGACEIKCAQGDLGMAYGDIDVQYIIEVMCCLDKEFQFIDCPGVVEFKNGTVDYDAFYAKDYPNIPVRPCRPDVPIAYPQISHL